jgi:hypothetical protein
MMKLSGSHSFVLKFRVKNEMAQNSVEQLRATNRVVPVSKEDEGRSWAKISNGVYGFTYTPASSDGGLFIKQPRQSYEMHKLSDGTLLILGYTTAELAAKLDSKGAQDVELYPESRAEYTVLVTVPHSRIVNSKALDRDDFNKLKAGLKPLA